MGEVGGECVAVVGKFEMISVPHFVENVEFRKGWNVRGDEGIGADARCVHRVSKRVRPRIFARLCGPQFLCSCSGML